MNNLTTYRTNAIEKPKVSYGIIFAEKIKIHKCETPGLWARIYDRIFKGNIYHNGTMCRCSCGKLFIFCEGIILVLLETITVGTWLDVSGKEHHIKNWIEMGGDLPEK